MTRLRFRGVPLAVPALLAAGLASCCAPAWAQNPDTARPADPGAVSVLSAGSATVARGAAPAGEGDRLRQLLLRSEVQAHLKLTVRQKNDLGLTPPPPARNNGAKNGSAGDDLPGVGGQVAVVVRPGEGDDAAATPEERQQRAEALLSRLRDQITADSQVRLNAIKDVLTPQQYARLLELDLQRRGPLALGDGAVAEQIKLDPSKRAPVAAAANEAQRRIGEATSEALRKSLGEPEAASGGVRIVAPARMEQFRRDMKNRLSPVRQKTDKIKKEAEANILALLSDDERVRWQDAQGEPFSFRTDH